MTVIVRPASAADIAAYYGEASPHTMHAVILEKAGDPVGIIGVVTRRGRNWLFSDHTPALGDDIRSFAVRRAVFQMLRLATSSKLPVFSRKAAESDVLDRLGFEHVFGDIYQWPNSPLSLPTSKPPPPQ